jgi:hypothetical protein
MWEYFAIRSGAEGLVSAVFRFDGQKKAELYHRQKGWTPNFRAFSERRLKGELDSNDRVTEAQALQIINTWQSGRPATLLLK